MAKKEKDQKKQSILTMDVGELFKQQLKKNAPQQGTSKAKKGMIKETKRTMNFVHHESGFNVGKVAIIALIAVVAIAIFVKVGFTDPTTEKSQAYYRLSTKQDELDRIQKRLGEFKELEQQYDRYSYGRMNESEINLVNRMDVLELVEAEIASRAFIDNFAVNNNVLTMNIYGITLEQASTIVNRLENNELVTSARVNSATADDGVEARIFISSVLSKVVQEAE
jgi:hypothetical protein